MPLGCFVCRSRKVRCDRAEPNCLNCRRLGVRCPGYNSSSGSTNAGQLAPLEEIFRQSGIVKRRVGSCEECRRTKSQCSRSRPKCRHCERRGIRCEYASLDSGQRRRAAYLDREKPKTSSRNDGNVVIEASNGSSTPGSPDSEFRTIPSHLTWLYSDSLPSEMEHLSQLFALYFERVASLRCLDFVHRASYLMALEDGELTAKYGEPLIYIIAAFGARFYVLNKTKTVAKKFGIPGQEWATRARDLAMKELPNPSLNTLMAMILICEYAMYLDQHALAYVIFGCCYRIMQLLSLDSEELPETGGVIQSTQAEAERRVVWSCYILDSFLGSGVDSNLSWRNDPPAIPLPISDDDFAKEELPNNGELVSAKTVDVILVESDLSVRCHIVYLMRFRTKVLRLIRRYNESMAIWDPQSPFSQVLQDLETWFRSLPEHLLIRPSGTTEGTDHDRPGAIFMLHFLYHSIVCDLTRISLPGYDFPLAKAFQNAPPKFRDQCRSQCRSHADEVAMLARIGLSHDIRAFDDLHSLMAIFESTKIQIIHAATAASNSREARRIANENIRTNLKVLDAVHSLQGKTNLFYKSLLPLIKKFGFDDIAAERAASHDSRQTSQIEVTGPAKTSFLSNLAPFRIAKERTQRRQTKSGATFSSGNSQTASLINTPHGSGPLSLQNVVEKSGTVGASTENGRDRLAAAPESTEAASQQQGFQYIAIAPNTLDRNEADMMQIDEFELAEGYSRIAGEMADYLCWDMSSGLPSWIDFDAISTEF